ncbi:hypothetical protein IDM32_04265 [Acinetobacter seifertii]|nr:hypothetical protein [Acinetobacter seifertii]
MGTVVNVNGTDYTVSATDLTNGYITAAIPEQQMVQLPFMLKRWMRKVISVLRQMSL